MYDFDNVLAKMEADLDGAVPGGEDYKVIVDGMAKIGAVVVDAERLNLDRGSKIVEEDLDERKFKEEVKANYIRAGIESGVKLISVVVGVVLFSYNLHAEANGLRTDSMFGRNVEKLINQR